MRAIIEQPVFAHADQYALELIALFELCWDERHALLTDPPFRPDRTDPVNRWLQGLSAAQAKRVRLVLDNGPNVALIRHRQAPKIRIAHDKPSHWEGNPPRLTVADALRLMRTPLKIVGENRRNERAFLRWLAAPIYRKALDEAEAKGWIEFEQGGGITEIYKRVNNLKKPGSNVRIWVERLRLWVMFDRDALPADCTKPSETSEELRKLCSSLDRSWPLGAHQLTRRAIENYLPKDALRKWAKQVTGINERKQRDARVDAFFDLRVSDQVRHSFHMKKGLRGDLRNEVLNEIEAQKRQVRDADLAPPFRGLPDQVRLALENGFSNAGALFHELKDPPPPEIPESQTLPQSIFERY